MFIYFIFAATCAAGFILFSKVTIDKHSTSSVKDKKISVIIPARNEEKNLPAILSSLKKQTYKPDEIIVIDDFSSDRTCEIAKQYGVKVISSTELPAGWTGKTWAVWNGFLESTGDVLVFLDADVRLAPGALEALINEREKSGGAISVVPYHYMEKPYERLSLVLYLLSVFAFTSPFERRSKTKGLYGSCIVASREDYEKVNGHNSIKSKVLDDMNLGIRFSKAGINVKNFIGYWAVSFRMYPYGIKSEMQGFAKSAVLGAAVLRLGTIALMAAWVIGLLLSGLVTPFLIAFNHRWALPFLVGYLVYAAQIFYFLKYTGAYGVAAPLLYIFPSLFFIFVMLYSVYQVVFVGSVSWKGRQVKV